MSSGPGAPSRGSTGSGLNLHTHLEGSVRPATAADLAASQGVPTPPGGWDAGLRMAAPGTLTDFLGHVALVYPLLGTPEAMRRVVHEAVVDAAADGTLYLELRFGPATHSRPGFGLSQVVAAACDGVASGVAATGMPAGIVVCELRHHDDDTNAAVARAAAGMAGRGVVGFDVAGDEALFGDLGRMRTPFAIAAAAGLGLTAHAAEAGPAAAVRSAVEVLGVRRIGHGSRAAEDPELLAWAADRGVCFEVCPTSNVFTGAASSYAEHPMRAFAAAGCDVVVGDDDPITIGRRLSGEFAAIADDVGIEPDAIRRIHAASIARAFCEPSTRRFIASRAAHLTDGVAADGASG